MKIEIKTDAHCVTFVTVAVCTADVAIQVYGTRTDFSEGWYPSSIVLVIHLILLSYLAKQLTWPTTTARNHLQTCQPRMEMQTEGEGDAKIKISGITLEL